MSEPFSAMSDREHYREIWGLGQWGTHAECVRVEELLMQVRSVLRFLYPELRWEKVLDVLKTCGLHCSDYFEAVTTLRAKVLADEWPRKDDPCPDCLGLGCVSCDFAGTMAGVRLMKEMEAGAFEEMDRYEEEHAAYVLAGVCSDCGATCPAEAERLCKPVPVGDTGEYTCPGEDLWHDQE